MKRYKVISATALAAMLLVTGSSTSVFAAEKKETITQQVVQASHVFSPQFIEQTKNLDAIPR
jgi:hypothetical protein